jgi:hypothetical protein
MSYNIYIYIIKKIRNGGRVRGSGLWAVANRPVSWAWNQTIAPQRPGHGPCHRPSGRPVVLPTLRSRVSWAGVGTRTRDHEAGHIDSWPIGDSAESRQATPSPATITPVAPGHIEALGSDDSAESRDVIASTSRRDALAPGWRGAPVPRSIARAGGIMPRPERAAPASRCPPAGRQPPWRPGVARTRVSAQRSAESFPDRDHAHDGRQ